MRFPHDASFLAGVELLNLTTRAGDLDIAFAPAGTSGYADLVVRAVDMAVRHLTIPVASLDDVIRSKSAANRPKDHRTLPILRQLLEEVQKRRR